MSAWRVDPYGDEVGVFIVKPSPHGRTWGEVEMASEHMRALIEAAPVLLAALEATLADLDFLHERARTFTSTVDADIMDQAMTRLRAALRAAKGETGADRPL